MSFLTADVTDERDALATFAHQQIHQLATTLHGLDREQLAVTPSASAMSLGALARHGIMVGHSNLLAILSAPDCPEPPHRDPAQVAAEGAIAPEALRPEDDAEMLIAELDQLADAAAEAIRAADLDAEVPIPKDPWYVGAERWNVRRCALHFVEEFARHTGHADILRESLDGKGAYELNALVDGGP